MDKPPPLTPVEFGAKDHKRAEELARELGYKQTAYTSSSDLWGLYCLPENPALHLGGPSRGGVIIKTEEFGLLFVQNVEDITRGEALR